MAFPCSADAAAGGGVQQLAPMTAPVSLWLLEDDLELCALLQERCAAQGWQLSCFDHPRLLADALQHGAPDLLVLDQMLPHRTGTEVLSRLRGEGYTFPVLMLSALQAPTDRISGLEAGADDYLGKPFVFRELQLRIRALLARSHAEVPEPTAWPTLASGPLQIGACLLRPEERQLVPPEGSAEGLSRGDVALLLCLCRQPGEVVSRQSLARATGTLVDVERSRTIDMRLSRLRRLLNRFHPGTDSLECSRGAGYRLTLPVASVH